MTCRVHKYPTHISSCLYCLQDEYDELRSEVEALRSSRKLEQAATDHAEKKADALRLENEALRADAERYRWLRQHNGNPTVLGIQVGIVRDPSEGILWVHAEQGLDAAIDAARGQP